MGEKYKIKPMKNIKNIKNIKKIYDSYVFQKMFFLYESWWLMMGTGQSSIIHAIEDNIQELVQTQEEVNTVVNNLNEFNYLETIEKIKIGLYNEKCIINNLLDNLNELFDCGWLNRFRIHVDGMGDRYCIRPPVFLNKASREYQLLKPVMINQHKKYFLYGGRIGYSFTSVESHMWEIPRFIGDNELVDKLRKEIGIKYNRVMI